jgi:KipI family sensor histidine kinase inhibitor
MNPVRILPAGDAALLVECPPAIDPSVNAWCVAFADRVVERYGAEVRDAVVGYCSVTVYFDPVITEPDALEQQLLELAAGMPDARIKEGTDIEVPVTYGAAFGPDLDDVARFGECTSEEVIARHTAVTYRVYLVGFVPGFAYMAEVDPRIAAPRRVTPRTVVPAGSVAIAGAQTGIYPDSTPGGWNIIGRTPLRPFDPAREEPSLFKPGDLVRFRPITETEFTGLSR